MDMRMRAGVVVNGEPVSLAYALRPRWANQTLVLILFFNVIYTLIKRIDARGEQGGRNEPET
jgi:hypothetical protein